MTSEKDKPKSKNHSAQDSDKNITKSKGATENDKFSPGEPDDYDAEEFATD